MRGLLVRRRAQRRDRRIGPTAQIALRVADLRRTDVQGAMLREGEIRLLRTGYVEAYLDADQDTRSAMGREQEVPGLVASQETEEFLWDERIAAVVADNPGVEVLSRQHDGPILHAS